jgi:hypothetical protein
MTPQQTDQLLDTVIDRQSTPLVWDGDAQQLSLFDQSEDGETFVAFDGQTL